MENFKHNKETAAVISHSNSLFGTSSDDIIDDLHHGNLQDTDDIIRGEFDDKEQIVNEEDQQEIVNPAQDETEKNDVSTETENADQAEQDKIEVSTDTDIEESDTEIESPSKKAGSDEVRTQKNLPKM